jgi:lactoylglutathione lyase
MRVIHVEAGKVVVAVPRNIAAMGMVASSGREAIIPPARAPTVITMTEAVWNSACAGEQKHLTVHGGAGHHSSERRSWRPPASPLSRLDCPHRHRILLTSCSGSQNIKEMGGGWVAKAIHSMIRVLNEARSVEFYRNAFGLQVDTRLDFESFTLLYLRNAEADFELELTVNKDRSEPYTLGDGYGHLAVVVDDLGAEHARLTEAGLAPRKLVDFAPGGEVIARFFFIADPDGYQIEVLQRHGRYR